MNFWDDDFSSEIKEISDYMPTKFYVSKLKGMDLDTVTEDLYIDAVIIKSWEHFKYLYQFRRSDLKKFTVFNQKHLSSRASPSLITLQEDKDNFLSLLLRLIHEFYFWEPSREELPDIINASVLHQLISLKKGSRINSQFLWIAYSMATSITRDLINSNEFQSIRKIASEVDQYEDKISELKITELTKFEQQIDLHKKQSESIIKTIENLEIDLDNYEKKLSEYKNEYNFILLSKAFKKMSTAKIAELTIAKRITWAFTILLSLPPLFTFFNHIFSWIDIGTGLNSLTFYLPILTLELLIFYFMRLYYGEVKTLNTQLLQIEHRLSLCEFVHDYIDKKNADKDNKSSWDAFEALIFSPIQISAENIPSLLDGANVVADIAGKVMSKSKS
ncbi:hypothetical protein [Kluyvera ascorbata]|uniref:hypothetical protein n=1 Tax=Kluyvera ascorbata TaxID=51288 RepID=UPI0034D41C65